MKIDSCAFLPKARSEGIITREVDDELLIYDRARDRAYCLNETAATVWKLCDGQSGVSEIIERLASRSQTAGEQTKVGTWRGTDRINLHKKDSKQLKLAVWLALDRLRRLHLLEETNGKTFWPPPIPEISNMSRREAVRRIGLGAAIAMPLVIAMTAPTPAEAAVSCKHHCDPCSSPIECCGTCSTAVPGCSGSPRCT